jgi:hypothetical protein
MTTLVPTAQEMTKIEVNWHIGGLPTVDGWYIVAKKGISSPSLMRFYHKSHDAWDRILAWDGPIIIHMDEVKY